jgi:hypothetical protein
MKNQTLNILRIGCKAGYQVRTIVPKRVDAFGGVAMNRHGSIAQVPLAWPPDAAPIPVKGGCAMRERGVVDITRNNNRRGAAEANFRVQRVAGSLPVGGSGIAGVRRARSHAAGEGVEGTRHESRGSPTRFSTSFRVSCRLCFRRRLAENGLKTPKKHVDGDATQCGGGRCFR